MTGIVVRTRREEEKQRRRILTVVAGAMFILGFFAGFVAGTVAAGLWRRPAGETPPRPSISTARKQPHREPRREVGPAGGGRTGTAAGESATLPPNAPVLAWQPSHQDERRPTGYSEYRAMGSLASLASSYVRNMRTVMAWDISSGLYGSNALPDATNTRAFDNELAIANNAKATFFVGLQTNAADESGVIVYYQENDETSAVLARDLSASLAQALKTRNLGRLGVRFYSLDPVRNRAPYRVVVEFRALEAELPGFARRAEQVRIAKALARAIEQAAKSRL